MMRETRRKKMRLFIFLFLILLAVGLFFLIFFPFSSPGWVLKEITFKASDGFELKAHLLRPKNPERKYPAVACLHQLWGNRDDFLKLYPFFAESGIIAIAPNFPRQKPNLNPRRISDLRDTVDFLEKMEWVDSKRVGIITASFSVETGLMAIRGKKNVIADVMISGPILSENSRKWLTQNSDLAIFTITSVFDEKPGDPPKHHLLMRECLARNVNPFSRSMFIKDKENRFSIYAHGTFVFDEFPESLQKIQSFFEDIFEIKTREKGVIDRLFPTHTIFFRSTDGFPVAATFKQPGFIKNRGKMPAVILYPPQFKSRTFYDPVINRLIARGIAVLAPNTKRTCRELRTIHLCDKEIGGAVNYLKRQENIDPEKMAVLFPPFYYLAAQQLIESGALSAKIVIFMETGGMSFGVNPGKIKNEKNDYKMYYLEGTDFKEMIFLLKKIL